ncbi:hypothetical protein GGX14DRAFT_389156 [Mycena pura]|uniref:Uncharacterized protein n=1 Tax=Mycena pura TaxID=153505 RepID=A0AAD6VRU4_9AGAR|nr:hypothetical protein GGX14DRAFT_389156 [Mycena pura]
MRLAVIFQVHSLFGYHMHDGGDGGEPERRQRRTQAGIDRGGFYYVAIVDETVPSRCIKLDVLIILQDRLVCRAVPFGLSQPPSGTRIAPAERSVPTRITPKPRQHFQTERDHLLSRTGDQSRKPPINKTSSFAEKDYTTRFTVKRKKEASLERAKKKQTTERVAARPAESVRNFDSTMEFWDIEQFDLARPAKLLRICRGPQHRLRGRAHRQNTELPLAFVLSVLGMCGRGCGAASEVRVFFHPLLPTLAALHGAVPSASLLSCHSLSPTYDWTRRSHAALFTGTASRAFYAQSSRLGVHSRTAHSNSKSAAAKGKGKAFGNIPVGKPSGDVYEAPTARPRATQALSGNEFNPRISVTNYELGRRHSPPDAQDRTPPLHGSGLCDGISRRRALNAGNKSILPGEVAWIRLVSLASHLAMDFASA